MNTTFKNATLQIQYRIWASIIIVTAIILWTWWAIFTFVPFNADAGYYLSCAERICEGWKPYKDFRVAYPPVGLYYYALFNNILGGGLVAYRVSLFTIQILSSVLVYLLGGLLIKQRLFRLLAALLFLYLYQAYDGRHFVIEYFVVTFSIVTLLLLTPNISSRLIPSFLAGVAWLLTVMSKQYGIVILPVIILLMFRDKNHFTVSLGRPSLRILMFILGFSLALWLLLQYLQMNIWVLSLQLKGTGYAWLGYKPLLKSLFKLRHLWYIVVLIVALYIFLKKPTFNMSIVLALFALNLVPLYVRIYPHYYQLSLPYATILLIMILEQFLSGGSMLGGRRHEIIVMLVLALLLSSTIAHALHKPLSYTLSYGLTFFWGDTSGTWPASGVTPSSRKRLITISDTMQLSRRINDILPPLSSVLVLNRPSFYYLCGFKPPTKQLSYSFIYAYNVNKCDFNRIESIVWFDGYRLDYDTFHRKCCKTHQLTSRFSSYAGQVEIWTRK